MGTDHDITLYQIPVISSSRCGAYNVSRYQWLKGRLVILCIFCTRYNVSVTAASTFPPFNCFFFFIIWNRTNYYVSLPVTAGPRPRVFLRRVRHPISPTCPAGNDELTRYRNERTSYYLPPSVGTCLRKLKLNAFRGYSDHSDERRDNAFARTKCFGKINDWVIKLS